MDELIEELDQKISGFVEQISSGACADYPAYCSAVGLIQGLRTARNLVEDHKKQAEENL